MTVKKVLQNLILITLIGVITYGVANKKIDLVKLADKVTATVHYYINYENKDYEKINIKGVPVFVAKNLSGEDKNKIAFALDNAKKSLSDKELNELKMIVFTPSNNLPDYLQNDGNVSRNVNDGMTEGFYVPSLKEIYIFPDVIQKDNSFDQDDVMLFVTLHEIGHHIDLSLKKNAQDNKAEKRATITAFNKISSTGINLDQATVESITDAH